MQHFRSQEIVTSGELIYCIESSRLINYWLAHIYYIDPGQIASCETVKDGSTLLVERFRRLLYFLNVLT